MLIQKGKKNAFFPNIQTLEEYRYESTEKHFTIVIILIHQKKVLEIVVVDHSSWHYIEIILRSDYISKYKLFFRFIVF